MEVDSSTGSKVDPEKMEELFTSIFGSESEESLESYSGKWKSALEDFAVSIRTLLNSLNFEGDRSDLNKKLSVMYALYHRQHALLAKKKDGLREVLKMVKSVKEDNDAFLFQRDAAVQSISTVVASFSHTLPQLENKSHRERQRAEILKEKLENAVAENKRLLADIQKSERKRAELEETIRDDELRYKVIASKYKSLYAAFSQPPTSPPISPRHSPTNSDPSPISPPTRSRSMNRSGGARARLDALLSTADDKGDDGGDGASAGAGAGAGEAGSDGGSHSSDGDGDVHGGDESGSDALQDDEGKDGSAEDEEPLDSSSSSSPEATLVKREREATARDREVNEVRVELEEDPNVMRGAGLNGGGIDTQVTDLIAQTDAEPEFDWSKAGKNGTYSLS